MWSIVVRHPAFRTNFYFKSWKFEKFQNIGKKKKKEMPLQETSNMNDSKRRATEIKKSTKRLKRSDTGQSKTIDLEKPT